MQGDKSNNRPDIELTNSLDFPLLLYIVIHGNLIKLAYFISELLMAMIQIIISNNNYKINKTLLCTNFHLTKI